jgi:molecular chaperone GrpE
MPKRFKFNDNQNTTDSLEGSGLEAEPPAGAPDPDSGGADGGATGTDESTKLQTQLAEKEREVAELKDRYLRLLADTDNARKRMRQQSEESVRIQRESFLRDLLPIVDNLERAVEAARGGGNGQPIVEGVELVLRSLLDFLKSHGVTQLKAVGQPFDPQLHEAVDQVTSGEHPPNTVVNEFHRGYLIGDRMLRTARVAVAKSGSADGSGEVEKN